MKLVDVKSTTYIDSSKEINDKGPKFKIIDTVWILKHKNIFAKAYIANWSEKVKNTVILKIVLLIIVWRRSCWNILRETIPKS